MCFYVHKTIKSTRCETVNSKGANEVLFVECGTGEDRLLVGVIYRSPNSPPDNNANLSSLIRGLDDIRKAHHRIPLVGDFNYPEIDWNRGWHMWKSNNTPSAGLLVGYPGRVLITTSARTNSYQGWSDQQLPGFGTDEHRQHCLRDQHPTWSWAE